MYTVTGTGSYGIAVYWQSIHYFGWAWACSNPTCKAEGSGLEKDKAKDQARAHANRC